MNKTLLLIILVFDFIHIYPYLAYLAYLAEVNPVEVYNTLLISAKGMDLKDINDLNGRIAWEESFLMDSFLEMYEATDDTKCLDIFISYADAILASRDDKAGKADWKGRKRPGWQVAGWQAA